MKKVLVTGENGYIGNYFEQLAKNWEGGYVVERISLKNEQWKQHSFSEYDIVLHAAGIAHRNINEKNKGLYYEINRDLAFKVALKAKEDGVKQFIFLSTMSVYGIEKGLIEHNTIPKPKNHYGKSKLEAENIILSLKSADFKIAIIRPPMVYGKNCEGNYRKLSLIAKKSPIFPEVKNRRSMLYIENLCEFIKIVIEDQNIGIFFPQNKEYVNTTRMVELISLVNNKAIWKTKLFNPFLYLVKINLFNKVFGDLYYSQDLSKIRKNYNVVDFEKSIYLSESKEIES